MVPPQPPRKLFATPIPLAGDVFREILSWRFPEEPFYLRQVQRMLENDLRHLVLFEKCTVWGYADPELGNDLIGFGTIQVSRLYSRFTGNLPHFYIPLLSIKPGIKSYGYGQSIVEHLVAEAAVQLPRWRQGKLASLLFLDVYTANEKAFRLYQDKCHFVCLNGESPVFDPEENNEPYVIMARNVMTQPKS